MKSEITHGGSVNGDPRYSLELTQIAYARISVDGVEHTSSVVTHSMTEPELRALILAGCQALEDRRIGDLLFAGGMTREEYDAEMRRMAGEGPRMPTAASLSTGVE